jgi:hypothetical protein
MTIHRPMAASMKGVVVMVRPMLLRLLEIRGLGREAPSSLKDNASCSWWCGSSSSSYYYYYYYCYS